LTLPPKRCCNLNKDARTVEETENFNEYVLFSPPFRDTQMHPSPST